MEEMEEAMGGPKHLTNNIVKGKRTKRQRPQSPIPFSLPTPSISTEENEEDDDDLDFYNPSSSEFDEEEEDMANCLILLAQGHRPRAEDHRQYTSKRYTSKRFVESNGKEGVYVYQCKTCDRAFPSFQALGGHRASHKKPKGGVVVEEKKIHRQLSFLSSDCEEEESIGGVERKPKAHAAFTNNSLMQLQLLGGSYSKSSPKVHECGICGAEFGSGQALGGHMRRHRVTVGTTASVLTATSLTLVSGFDMDTDKEISEIKKSKSLLSLDLDLNLPAPAGEEKQQQINKQQQQQNQNQSGLVFSTGTLVDCHY